MATEQPGGWWDDGPAPAEATPAVASLLVVEDEKLLAQIMVQHLRAQGVHIDEGPLDSRDAILAAAREHPYDLVLLDLDLGDRLGYSTGLIQPLRQTGARVAMLTAVDDRERHAECIEAGAVGIITKSRGFDHLMAKLQEVTAHGSLLGPGERDALMTELRRRRGEREQRRAPFQRLTPREQEVLGALMAGMTTHMIAQEWVVSYETVRTQIRSVLAKLEVHSQLQAVALAQQAGWTPPGASTTQPLPPMAVASPARHARSRRDRPDTAAARLNGSS